MYWIDSEKMKPTNGSEIIFEDAVGMFKGKYLNHGSGIVKVMGKPSDTLLWEDVYQWIYYPKNY